MYSNFSLILKQARSPQVFLAETNAWDDKLKDLESGGGSLQSKLQEIQGTVEELVSSRGALVSKVMCGVQSCISSRIGNVETTVESLGNIAESHSVQITQVLDKNERLFQMLGSMVVGGAAAVGPSVSLKADENRSKVKKGK